MPWKTLHQWESILQRQLRRTPCCSNLLQYDSESHFSFSCCVRKARAPALNCSKQNQIDTNKFVLTDTRIRISLHIVSSLYPVYIQSAPYTFYPSPFPIWTEPPWPTSCKFSSNGISAVVSFLGSEKNGSQNPMTWPMYPGQTQQISADHSCFAGIYYISIP